MSDSDIVYDTEKIWVITFNDVEVSFVTTFKSFVKAKSRNLAKQIFLKKISTQEPNAKISLLKISKLHKTFNRRKGEILSLAEWEAFRKLSFPNTVNSLFKISVRVVSIKDYLKSQNGRGVSLKRNNNGFGGKLGKDSWSFKNLKGKSLPKELRPYYRYRGRWVKISDEEREKEKLKWVELFKSAKGNKSLVAKNINRTTNYVLRHIRNFPEVDWSKFKEV